MAEIKPDEISAILRQQLSNFNASADPGRSRLSTAMAMVLPVYMGWAMYVRRVGGV
jgi:hypothetical protein